METELESKSVGFESAKLFRTAHHDHGYVQLFIIGPQACGKTTFAMHIGYDVYRILHPTFTEEEVWQRVLDRLYFDIRPSITLFKEARQHRKQIPLIIYDDVGVHLSKYTPFMKGGFQVIKAVKGLFDTIRTVCNGVVITSPKLHAIKAVQEMSWFKCKIFKSTEEDDIRIAKIWEYSEEVWGEAWHTCIIEDEFRLVLPDWVREKYEDKRGETVDSILDECEKALTATPKYELNCCEVYELYQQCGGKIRETARKMGKPPSTIQSAIERHKRHTT
ncbi:MAG: hypothetical protein ABIH76_05985 [Candidatus Bathyarchaeota archaeon]